MHVAVKGMYAERRVMWGMFFLGILSFWAAITFYVWIIIPVCDFITSRCVFHTSLCAV